MITFEDSVVEISGLIDKRKSSWRLQNPEWEDVKQIILIKIWKKFDQYDENRPLENWANVVITRSIINLLRDNIYKSARPCISVDVYGNPCVYNMGDNTCSFTKSGIQCGECKAYANWQKKKESQANLGAPVSLEDHEDESNNLQSDFLDIEATKEKIDAILLKRLNTWDKNLYQYMYIDHLSEAKVFKKLKVEYTKTSKARLAPQIAKARKRFKIAIKQIIEEIGL